MGLGTAKALISICGKTLIERQLEYFKDVEDVRVVVGFQAREVMEEVLKYRKDVIFVFNHNYFETKTGFSFYLGSKNAKEYCIECDGDLIVNPGDMQNLLEQEGEWLAYSELNSNNPIFIDLDDAHNKALSFSEKSGKYEWTGPCCIRKDKIEIGENVYDQIKKVLPLKAIKIRAYDIDTYEDYRNIMKVVENEQW
ncbi:NTP transferase domain-containing protein [Helicobacter pullorum]|uniref:NTP transferase domain-containing protein n=1 Tax=Helicobacter pullorum TaxID=35818 RepID=UPI000A86E279|nr:NTP transferase domain-containing protein [Helicobacter pullorum]